MELDKCAEEFRALHEERKDLIARLEESLSAIVNRDSEIARQGARFAALKGAQAAKRDRVVEAEARLQLLERENREGVSRQEAVVRARSDAKDRVQVWTARVTSARDGLETAKGELVGAAGELSSARAKNAQWGEEIGKREAALAAAKAAAEEVKARRTSALAASSSVEEAVAKKDAFLKREGVRVEKLEKEVSGLREAVTVARGTLGKLGKEVEETRGEIAGAERADKNMRDRLVELDAAASRQAEHAYTADFQIAQMERKVGRALFLSPRAAAAASPSSALQTSVNEGDLLMFHFPSHSFTPPSLFYVFPPPVVNRLRAPLGRCPTRSACASLRA